MDESPLSSATAPPQPREDVLPEPSAPAYVYALGKIDVRFPTPGVENEFKQASSEVETVGLTDRQALLTVLTAPDNRYLARQLCWVMTIQNHDVYLLVPRHPEQLDMLLNTIRSDSEQSGNEVDVVIGAQGPIAPPEICNGLMVP